MDKQRDRKIEDRVSELIKEIHQELNARGEYNTYLITENLRNNQVLMQCFSQKDNLSEEEKKSFSNLFSRIKPYIKKRTKMFEDAKGK
ncbi:hypothetical protein EDM00_05910 [Ornithobacterium rhinotracheale]|uniref:hypothetical protein n=1 Tax=Ornithobacterium rhinotracheale TaxID=28251 RepID=UPI00129D1E2A|nr:hypothetical protein [Ornithobacterium rhinotracheale]MRI63524.1 hypothetical protein [Ornithobacterium rhinotracheale]